MGKSQPKKPIKIDTVNGHRLEKKNVNESIGKMHRQSWTYTSHLHCVYRHLSVISSIYESFPCAGFYFADQVK